MKYIQLSILFLVCVARSYGQTDARSYHTLVVVITKEKKQNRITSKAELPQPAFSGGDSSWIQSLQDTLNKSMHVGKRVKAGSYTVELRFLIENNGSISDVVCLKDPGFRMCEQVKKALRKKFKWGPQTDSSGKVRRYHTRLTTTIDALAGCVQHGLCKSWATDYRISAIEYK